MALKLIRKSELTFAEALKTAHVAYAKAVGKDTQLLMVDRTVDIVTRLNEAITKDSFMSLSVMGREELAPVILSAINGWLTAAYSSPTPTNIRSLFETAQLSQGIAQRARKQQRIPVAVEVRFASPGNVATVSNCPPWRTEQEHILLARRFSEENLFQDIRPFFGSDIDALRSLRRRRVQNALTSNGEHDVDEAFQLWEDIESTFASLLGKLVRYGRNTNQLPYGKRLADHVEQIIFECTAAALEGDTKLFEAAATLAETSMYAAVLGPVACTDAVGVWAAFHLIA